MAGGTPAITTTKSAAFEFDADGDGTADFGDIIRYTVEIENTGTSNATNVVFNDMVDPNTTLIGSVLVSPVAADDSYESLGNVGLDVPASDGLLLNDSDPDNNVFNQVVAIYGDTAAIGATAITEEGGFVRVESNGAFTYTPPLGFTGVDRFVYTLSDGDANTPDDNATVTIEVARVLWFIDSSQAQPGDGRINSPFNSIDGPDGYEAAAADGVGDVIYIYKGDGTDYVGPINLLDEQVFLSDGSDGDIPSEAGLTVPPFSRPIPVPPGGVLDRVNIVSPTSNGVNLANDNRIRGIVIKNTLGAGFVGFDVGDLFIDESSVAATSGGAVDINVGNIDINFNCIQASSSNRPPLRLRNVTGEFQMQCAGTGTLVGIGQPGIEISNGPGGTLNINTLQFRSIDSSDADYGIILRDIALGSFAVNGTGTTSGSGGTLESIAERGIEVINTDNVTLKNLNLTSANTLDGVSATLGSTCDGLATGTNIDCNAAVYLSQLSNVTLDNLRINGTEQNGINGNNVIGFTLTNSQLRNIGNVIPGQRENGLHMINLAGAVEIGNNFFEGDPAETARNLVIENGSGSLDLTLEDNLIDSAVTNGFYLLTLGTASVDMDAFGNSFSKNGATQFDVVAVGNSEVDLLLGDGSAGNQNTFIGDPATPGTGGGLRLLGREGAAITFNMIGNEIQPVFGTGITVLMRDAAVGEGNIIENEIQGVTDGWGILAAALSINAEPQLTLLIESNTIGNVAPIGAFGSDTAGIEVDSVRDGAGSGKATVNAIINKNTIVIDGASSTIQHIADGGNVLCLEVTNNTVSGQGTSPIAGAGSTHHIINPPIGSTFGAGSIEYVGYISGDLGNTWNANGNVPAIPGGIADEATVVGTEPSSVSSCQSPSVSGQQPQFLYSMPEMSGEDVAQLQGWASQEADAGMLDASPAAVVETAGSEPIAPVAVAVSRGGKLANIAFAGEAVSQSLGTLQPSQAVTIIFDVEVTGLATGLNEFVCNQGSVSADGGILVDTDEPSTAAAGDPTCIPLAVGVGAESFTGTIGLQGRGPAPDPSLVVPVTMEVYSSGVLINTLNLTADQNGEFEVSNVAVGSYTVFVKPEFFLARLESLVITAGSNSQNFGEFLGGDVNNDNEVNIVDFSILASTFNLSDGDPGFIVGADIDGDDNVNLVDFSILATNFNQSGEEPSQ
ncbi:MAG: Ig-like domain-containing protein [Chloroflexota bacterium]